MADESAAVHLGLSSLASSTIIYANESDDGGV